MPGLGSPLGRGAPTGAAQAQPDFSTFLAPLAMSGTRMARAQAWAGHGGLSDRVWLPGYPTSNGTIPVPGHGKKSLPGPCAPSRITQESL